MVFLNKKRIFFAFTLPLDDTFSAPPIDSQTNVIDHNVSNDVIDSQLNSKDDDDNDDD